MIRSVLRHEDATVQRDLTPEEAESALTDDAELLWMDINQEPPEVVEKILSNGFNFHPLAIDDALNEQHVAKVDDWQTYLYIVLRGAALPNEDDAELLAPELDIFLGRNFLVTYSDESVTAVDKVWNLCYQDERWLARGPDFLLYRLADELVTDMMDVANEMHFQIDALEEDIFGDRPPDTLEDLFTLKRNILRLRRIVLPERDTLLRLSRDGYSVIDEADRIFFRDVYDHLLRLHDVLDEMVLLVSSALDTYLSVINNRMNDIMKTLTIITALFMPLAFITGFFGMNFFTPSANMPELTGRLALLVSMLIMAGVPAGMFWWMHHRGWI
ncbi:MAG: magnesium/cobalt transporter CorA [Candidatus Promineifilaceae bacterium]